MGLALRGHLAESSDISWHAELVRGGGLAPFIACQPEVVVDLSTGPAVDAHGPQIVAAKIPYIIGATGLSQNTLDKLASLASSSNTPVLVVPNFSLAASLMLRFAAQAAALMDSPVIIERHHEKKVDAPSGTAVFTAQRIANAQGTPKPPTTGYHENAAGLEQGVAIHSIRGAGYLAEQEVSFSLPGESLSIEHKSIDRRCFMPGIIYAIRNIQRVAGLQVGLDTILEL